MWFIGVEIEKRRVHPLLKKILDSPLLCLDQWKSNKWITVKYVTSMSSRYSHVTLISGYPIMTSVDDHNLDVHLIVS